VAVSGLAAMVAALYEVPRAAGGTDPACAAWKDCDLRFARDPWLWFIPLLDCKNPFLRTRRALFSLQPGRRGHVVEHVPEVSPGCKDGCRNSGISP
jgi:hypothetical protein